MSKIIEDFNDKFGNIAWRDKDRTERRILRDIPERVKSDSAYQNAIDSGDQQNARIEFKRALSDVVSELRRDDTELFKHYSDSEDFKKWMEDSIYYLTNNDDYLDRS